MSNFLFRQSSATNTHQPIGWTSFCAPVESKYENDVNWLSLKLLYCCPVSQSSVRTFYFGGCLNLQITWTIRTRYTAISKTLSKEKQKAHKPGLQGNMGIFETS